MSWILSYGKLKFWAMFERINYQVKLPCKASDLLSYFLLGLKQHFWVPFLTHPCWFLCCFFFFSPEILLRRTLISVKMFRFLDLRICPTYTQVFISGFCIFIWGQLHFHTWQVGLNQMLSKFKSIHDFFPLSKGKNPLWINIFMITISSKIK